MPLLSELQVQEQPFLYYLLGLSINFSRLIIKRNIFYLEIKAGITAECQTRLSASLLQLMAEINLFIGLLNKTLPKSILSVQLVILMENTHTVYPFLHRFPFLYYQNWNPMNYHYVPGTMNPPKQVETREFLGQPPKPQNQHVESPPKNDQRAISMKIKKSIQIEKLRRKRDREDNYQRKVQKKDRNMPSNIFKNLANFFYLNPNIVEFVTKLIPAQLTVSPQRLIQKFKQTIKFGQSYIRPVAIQSLCKQGTFTKEEAQVFRIVLRRFLLVEMPVLIMSQNKLKRKQRSQYIKMGKKLYGQLNRGAFE